MKDYAKKSDFEINREVLSYFVKDGGEILSYAHSGARYDDITGSISDYEHEWHSDNITRAAMIVFLMMKDAEK